MSLCIGVKLGLSHQVKNTNWSCLGTRWWGENL